MTNSTIGHLTEATTTEGAEVAVEQSGANRKISVGAAIKMEAATEKDVLAGTSNDVVVTPLALNDKIEEIEKELGAFYSDYDIGADTAVAVANNVTQNIPEMGESLQKRNSSSFNIATSSLDDHKLYFVGTACTGFPVPGSGTFQGGLLFNDGNGVRWLFPSGHPQIMNSAVLADAVIFYWDAVNAAWVEQTYNGDRLRPSALSCPDDSDWWPISAQAHDEPPGNAFLDEFLLAKRSGNNLRVVRLWYNSAAQTPSSYVKAASRAYELPIRREQSFLYQSGSGVAPSSTTTYTLTNGAKFSDHLYWTCEIGGGSGNTSPDSVSPFFPGDISVQGSAHFCMVDCLGSTNRIEVLSDTTFKYAAGGTNSKLYNIRGVALK